MTTIFNINKKIFSITVIVACLFIGFAATGVHAAANDSSITLKKDPSSGLFTLTVKDPDGVQEFSMTPAGKFSYGGGLSGCPKTFSNNNVLFSDPGDFEPVMPAYVIDCKNNTTNLEIAPPKNGLAKSTLVAEEETPLPPPVPREVLPEEKSGPLSASDIQYPVPDLGNCQSEKECRSYCDNSERAKECFAFAKKYHLISEKEAADEEKKFFEVKKGPGGCDSGISCEAYCNNVDRLDECIAFAEESGYYTGDQLAEAKKFQELVKNGTEFPGGCRDRNACELYCNDAGHMEECLNFAEKTGVMPKEEIEQARKILPLIKSGETPGGCVSKEQCEKYCSEDSHTDECIAFGEKAGFISPEDAEMIKKTGGKGPGGCHSKQQCESYCEANSDECFRWAQENGLMSEADLAKMKKGLSQFKEQLDKVPPEVTQCLKDAVGEENFQKLSDGQPIFDRSLEGKMKSCFSEITAQVSQQLNTLPPEAVQCIKDTIGEDGLKKLQSGESDENVDFSSLEGCFRQIQSSFGGGQGGPGGPGGFSGPGGCKSINECTAYCQENQDECQHFVPPGGGGPGGPGGGQGGFQGGPGGCTSQEECMEYCKDHQEECQNFSPPGGGQGGQGQQHDGFSECGIVPGAVAIPVCGINGKGAPPGVETTYFNRCHAEQSGVQILHDGECKEEKCHGIADPVCGNDNINWTSPCAAEEHGGGVKHKGVCTSEDFGGTGGSGGGGGFGGPGGCQSEEECQAYCQAHPAECSFGGGTPPVPTQSCAPLPSGLVSWWDEDTLKDASGGITIAPGKVGNAFKFNGSGYMNIGNLPSLNFGTGPFSFEFWFLWNGGDGVHNIIRKSNYPVSGPGAGYWLRIGAGNLEFFTGETTGIDGEPRGIVTASVRPQTWYHVVATRDSSGTMSLYIDGQLKGTANASGANTTSEAPFTLGAWDDRFGVTEFFSGILDEATVYNRALSAAEAQSIFNAGSRGKCTVESSSSEGGVNYQQQFQQQYEEQYQQQSQQSPSPTNYSGPGGCTNAQECQTYCTQNYQDPACQQFAPPPPSSMIPFSSFLGTILGPWLLLLR